jgi:uncharacterized protein (TIGR01777 family)
MKKILITGGSGMIGFALTSLLIKKGFQVVHLSRSKTGKELVETYIWNLEQKYLDPEALHDVEIIVHLAGAGIADKPWTESRKKIILSSRTDSAELLLHALQEQSHSVKTLVSASAIGIFGSDRGEELLNEESSAGNDFLAHVTKEWEAAAYAFKNQVKRVVTVRIGLVLDPSGGLLDKMLVPTRFGAGAPLGSGKQWMSWVHRDDLINFFVECIENQNLNGAYNAVAPNPVRNKEFTRKLAKVMNKPAFLPAVPSFALKLALGEMAQMIVGGLKVSSKKVEDQGFTFKFPHLEEALANLLR